MLTIDLLGGFSVCHSGQALSLPSRNSRLLLAYLGLTAGRRHTRSHLAGILWPDLPETTARRRLSHALWEIGQALPDDSCLERTNETVGFQGQLPHHIDVVEFEQSWQQAQRVAAEKTARSHLRTAADLYGGTFLEGFYEDRVLIEQERLREIYLQVLQRLIGAEKAAGAHDAALGATLALIAVDPLREVAYQEGMRLYQQLGRHQEVRRLYEQCRERLRTELDADPAPETRAILDRLDEGRALVETGAPVFTSQDLPLVGRERERQALLRHLDETVQGHGGVVLVAGEAGVGKSRLLRTLAEDAAWRAMTVLWGRTQDLAADAP